MATLLLLSKRATAAEDVLPSLSLLNHKVQVVPAEASSLLEGPRVDALLLDARTDLAACRALCRVIQTTGKDLPLLVVVTEGGLTAMSSDWGFDDLVLDTAGPAEIEARLRLATTPVQGERDVISSGGVVIDEAGYSARLNGRQLDLTYTEFELLKYLVQHPGRVFSREQLLSDVWGYDYYGGTRTVDVHIRRLRAKLGPEHESIIGTVRNVGYRFVVKP
ncbi:winged helix-turn-helix transcriptional regulator [Desertihabitans aurantiacus]|uniref:winged helix-turn-helix transcriptional regulator n=1 Tax=Desertihabitans aurantiacus TaxID=2282477 RepID=UPI000DF7E3CC|nr:response regulator transcription factor [Desertihabitans aurantiacus]